jgi:hypothetical protein
MGSRNTIGLSANLEVIKADSRGKQKSRRKYKLLTERTKSFLQPPSYSGRLQGSHMASSDLGESQLASGGHMLPQGVAGGLPGSGVAFGVMDALVGLQMASGADGDLLGSRVPIWGHGSWVASGVRT